MGVIYVRPNLINGKKYVGQATNLKVRQNDWKNLNKRYAGAAINNARAKYGIDNFGFEILKECKDDELDYWERYYIKELNTKKPYGYNLTDGGETIRGYTHTEETKRKIGEWHKGLVRSEETRKKLSEANKGKHLTEETRNKLSEANKGEKNPNYGKHWSEEHKKKLSEALKGRKRSEETKKKISEKKKGIPNIKLSKPVLQIDKDTNEVIAEFPSVSEVERQLGYKQSSISACCNEKRPFAYNYKWKYAV